MNDSYNNNNRRSGNYIALAACAAVLGAGIALGVSECSHKIKSLEDQLKHQKCDDKPHAGKDTHKGSGTQGTPNKPAPVKQETPIINIYVTPCPNNDLESITQKETSSNQVTDNSNNNTPKRKGLFNRKRYTASEGQYDGNLKIGDTFLYEEKLLRYDGGSSYGHPNFIIISAQGNMGNPYNGYYNMNFVRGSLFPGFVGNLNAQVFMNYNMGRLNNINMMYNSGFMNVERVGNSLHSTMMPNYNQRRVNAFRIFGQ